MDYKELIAELRFVSQYEMKREYNEICVGELLLRAADAIEALQQKGSSK